MERARGGRRVCHQEGEVKGLVNGLYEGAEGDALLKLGLHEGDKES